MTLKKILIFIIPVSILAIIGLFLISFWQTIPDYSPTFDKIKLTNSTSTDSVFIKRKVWGVTANHEIIVISKRNNVPFIPDSTNDFIFTSGGPFFYKFVDDTLLVFVPVASKKPKKFNSTITVEQRVLTNHELMNLFDYMKKKI